MARKSTTRKAAKKPAAKKPAAKGKFLLAKGGRRKNTTDNARKGKSFVTTASKKKGFVEHVYNIKGKRTVVLVKKKGAKAAKAPVSGGRTYKRVAKGAAGGGRFSK
jgi:hypothetical protein